MTLDPQAKWVLDIAEQAKVPPLEEMTAHDAKLAYEERAQKLCLKGVSIGKIEDRKITGVHGEIPIRIYHPECGGTSLPVLVYYHGGGWVVGSCDSHDGLCRQICNQGSFIVVSIDYRMGPDTKFPAAIDDAIASYEWVLGNAESFRADRTRVAVGGDSAGGNLAAVVCLNAKANNTALPQFQWLIYPATNMAMDTQSHSDFSEGYFLTKSLMVWFQEHYLNSPDDVKDWRASPLIAKDLSDLPAALVQTAGFDPLKDEGKAYADRLEAAGVKVSYTDYPGMIHGFINLGGVIDAAHTAIEEGIDALQKAFR